MKTPPKSRLGTDPFSWIRDTREDEPQAEPAAQAAPAAQAEPASQTASVPRTAPVPRTEPAPPAVDSQSAAPTGAIPSQRPAKASVSAQTDTGARKSVRNENPAAAPQKASQAAPAAKPQPAEPRASARRRTAPAPTAQPKAQEASAPQTARPLSEDDLRALIAQQLAGVTPRRGRPRSNFREVTKSSQEGLPEDWTRATFIVRESLLEDLKDYAYTRRVTIRDVLDEALSGYLKGKELLRRPK